MACCQSNMRKLLNGIQSSNADWVRDCVLHHTFKYHPIFSEQVGQSAPLQISPDPINVYM